MRGAAKLAGGLNIVSGALAIALYFVFPSASTCPVNGCSIATSAVKIVIPLLGIMLLVDGLVGLYGLRLAFSLGGIFSAVIGVIVLYEWAGRNPGEVATGLAVVSFLAVIANLLAISARGGLSEQTNPMNLPVFG
jgi:hypothetical protein